jgi:hypothetical protein
MTNVRCPGCRHVQIDPPEDFTCPSCGRRLRRTDDNNMAVAVQLGLFGEAVPVELVSRSRRHPVARGLDLGGRFQSQEQSEKDALAVITEFFHNAETDPAGTYRRTEALLAAKAAIDIRETAFAAAWVAANCLQALEDAAPGWGVDLLRAFALNVAARKPAPGEQ